MYVIVGMILPVLVEIVLIPPKEFINTTKELLKPCVPKRIGTHNSIKPYSDAELEPT
jgi:hypothetical protein